MLNPTTRDKGLPEREKEKIHEPRLTMCWVHLEPVTELTHLRSEDL